MENYWTSMLVSIAPFLALLALWFFLLRQMSKGAGNTKKSLVDPLREIAQAIIVPEIRAVRESVDALRAEIKARDERREQ
jgi:ATP-dependent Zn protease